MPHAPQVLILESAGLGDRSYVVHDGRDALVIDPQRDIDRVEALVADHGLAITHVAETHIHNDYVTGGLELARRHDADYVVPIGVDLGFIARALGDRDSFDVGTLRAQVLHTPGHTPHHVSFAVSTADSPGVVFTGGSLLYGSVGRPDLVAPDLVTRQAHDQWQSAHRLADLLPGETSIYPTHGFGSFCSATQTQGTSSTLSRELAINPALVDGEAEFVARTLAGLDVFPSYYAHMGPANAAGPADVDLSPAAPADPAELRARILRGEWVVDLRARSIYAAGHVPGAMNFDLSGSFVSYLAWMVPWGTPITLLGDTADEIARAQRELVRVGIDRPAGAVPGGLDRWLVDPSVASVTRRVSFEQLATEWREDSEALVLDTRQILEWEAGHVEGAVLMPFYEIPARIGEIPRDRTVYAYCGSGYRASAAASVLRNAGLDRIVHVDDSFSNAAAAGLPIIVPARQHREPGWTWIASRASVRTFHENVAGTASPS